jgi:hypothetical protein
MTGFEFFGEPWPSGICDDGKQVPTPIGEACVLCAEPIVAGDRGSFMVSLGFARPHGGPVHRECSLRSVLGGIAHLNGSPNCTCRGGTDPDDGLSYRASALRVWELCRGRREAKA